MANPVGRPKREVKKRVPVSGAQDILTVDGMDKDYVYRWVNDTEGRLSKFEAAGYTFAEGDEQIAVSGGETIGSRKAKSVGKGVTAYLMKQKKEFYEEDQKAKREAIMANEAAIKNPNVEGKYGSIQIK